MPEFACASGQLGTSIPHTRVSPRRAISSPSTGAHTVSTPDEGDIAGIDFDPERARRQRVRTTLRPNWHAILPARGWQAIRLPARRTEDSSTLAPHDALPPQERRVAEAVPDEDPAELIREVLAIEREITARLEKLLEEVK